MVADDRNALVQAADGFGGGGLRSGGFSVEIWHCINLGRFGLLVNLSLTRLLRCVIATGCWVGSNPLGFKGYSGYPRNLWISLLIMPFVRAATPCYCCLLDQCTIFGHIGNQLKWRNIYCRSLSPDSLEPV